jgi:hypothetical protein
LIVFGSMYSGQFEILCLPVGSPARETLAASLIGAGLALREIAEERFGLEDIFLAATRRAPGEGRRP